MDVKQGLRRDPRGASPVSMREDTGCEVVKEGVFFLWDVHEAFGDV